MPFIIAGFLYGLAAAIALAAVGCVCLVRRRPPGAAARGGALGSLAGFAIGCVAGAAACIPISWTGARVGATAIVVVASLIFALLGAALGSAASRETS